MMTTIVYVHILLLSDDEILVRNKEIKLKKNGFEIIQGDYKDYNLWISIPIGIQRKLEKKNCISH
jgi:hypothetical protein